MTRALRHRGPDDEGFYGNAELDLGFRRLAVIDLETGAQPIRLSGDRAVIVLNGEIYNFPELRRELIGRHAFRSRGDVEVVLRLYEDQGLSCLTRLNGMFALAIWDAAERTLHLARDRFGIKPLFYCSEGGRVAFGSEVTALAAAGFPRRRRLDPVQLRHYLSQGYLLPDGGPWQGVQALPPGTAVSFSPAGVRTWSYWEPPVVADPGGLTRRTAAVEVGRTLERAVERQLVSDVPVGVFLSGGLDSSTLAVLVARCRSAPVETFSVGFAGPGAVSELPFARRVAGRLGSVHHEFLMTPEDAAGDLERILASLDGPLADPTVVPTWYLSRLARSRVTVALSGEGADEVFGGYPRQRLDVLMDGARRVLPRPLAGLLGFPFSPRLRARLALPPGLHRQQDWSRLFSAGEIDALLFVQDAGEHDLLAALDRAAALWDTRASRDRVNARLATDLDFFLAGDLLPKVDRMSMAHSLEVRVPYLDHEVTDLVLALPGRWKVGLRRGKRLLRLAAANLVSPEVLGRPKQGFDVPVGTWLRGPLRPVLEAGLSEAALCRRGVLRPAPVAELLRQHLAGTADHGRKLWALLVLELWLQGTERQSWKSRP